ncbi:2-oxoacid:acceptor oxidoreductase family protein [Methanomicrobium antiquum]|uniref:2-oxoacid:acceptor oxidoreductase family protein n=1 Tax=Methanomicrobium antiquum TaxID=487686 RepID=A0AAF0FWK4_9EURY|nr:2-oxoacid:acceptor oxidoreductase family protein [Methanomicrobium antiquum]MDD3976665.1 2-oxoacid:acceptor oxidoreductase family protein [Methanomicrobium sp.]WFN37280.1 2-oxoacid:acceptor oxidoreductase family protein [Methanomicrobium antiquum]
MRHEVLFSGFGGQGIILSAVVLGRAAAIYDKKYAVQTQVYGPEARGGASMSAVVIDDEEILYPEVSEPDIYVIMSQQGYEKYGLDASDESFMILDSALVFSRPECRNLPVSATEEAKRLTGRAIVANIIMLGALVSATGVVTKDAIEKAVLDSVPKGTEELNLKALNAGFELGMKGGSQS